MSNVSSSNGLEKYPKLRFKGFSDPWKCVAFSDIADINPKSPKLPPIFYYIDLESVKGGRLLDDKIVEAENAPSRAQRMLVPNDIIFQTVRPYQQNNYFYEKERDLPSIASTGYAVIRTKQDAKFIYSLIHTQRFLTPVMQRCTGSSYPAVTGTDLEDIPAWIPCLEEQKRIGSFLDLIGKKIDAQTKLIETLKKYKRGLLKQVFNENYTWDEVPLGKIATIYQPQTISSEQLVEYGKYPVYGANGQIGWYNDFNHDSEQIAICCRGASCGTVNYIPAYSWITGNAMVINISDSVILKKFVYHQLCSQNLSYMISGSGQPQIVRTPCVEHKIFVPTSEVQVKITALFDLLDQKIAIQEKVLDRLIITKKGCLQKLFV